MSKLFPVQIPHTFRLASILSAVLAAALALLLAAAVPALAAGAPKVGDCGVLDNCDVAEVGATSVVLEPSIEANGAETEYSLEYALAGSGSCRSGSWTPVPGGQGSVSAAEREKTLHIELTRLRPETTYYVCVDISNVDGMEEATFNFTTEGLAPRALGTTVVSTTDTSAEVQGQFKPHLETHYDLEYATAESGPWTSFAGGTVSASDKLRTTSAASLTGLAAKTTYYVREFLNNADGEATSPPTSFETVAPPVTSSPSIESESVTSITEHDATLEAQINPGGLETTYEFWREYAVCQGPGVHCESIAVGPVAQGQIAAGDEAQTVSVELTNLQPNYSYTYWVVATNSAGTTKTSDQKFETLPEGTPSKAQEEPLASSSGGDQPGAVDDGAGTQPSGSSVLLSSPLATVVDVSSPHMQTPPTMTGNTVKLAKALKVCEKRPRSQRARCERQAHSKYARTAKDTGKKASRQNRKKRR